MEKTCAGRAGFAVPIRRHWYQVFHYYMNKDKMPGQDGAGAGARSSRPISHHESLIERGAGQPRPISHHESLIERGAGQPRPYLIVLFVCYHYQHYH
jgi:hypothetical protein